MNSNTSWDGDITYHEFRGYISGGGLLSQQRAKKIQHSTLRYIQRVLAHSPRVRNHEEPHIQPHLGYYLAKHHIHMETEHKSNGNISVGGVITKIARALNIDVTVGNPGVVPGPTTLTIQGLVAMSLIKKSLHFDYYYNVGTRDVI